MRILTIALLLGMVAWSLVPNQGADLILYNGNIVTVDRSFSMAELMCVERDKIVHVGQNQDLTKWKSPKTRLINLEGRTVLPGFVEPHTHPVLSAALYNWIDVSGMKHRSAKAAIKQLQNAAKTIPKGQWILAFGWDFMLLDGAFPLTRDYLDREISSEHPIWVMMQSMHTHYFNSMAFELAGVSSSTPDPTGGGHYLKDENGRLTGIVTESATTAPFAATFPKLSQWDLKLVMQKMFTRYNAAGITTIGAAGIFPDIFPANDVMSLLAEMSRESPVQVRLFYYDVGKPDMADKYDAPTNDFLRRIGQKFWIDGSPYTGSMLVKEPYEISSLNQDRLGIPAGSTGHTMFPEVVYPSLFKQAHNLGWQVAIHSQGDAASDIAINALDKILTASPTKDHRHRMEHLALVTESQLNSMAKMGVTPSFHINHIYYYGDSLSKSIIGEKRAERLMPAGDALRAGHRFSFHTDSPMYPPSPLLTMRTAITRKSSSGLVLGENQCIPIEEALKAVTINAAWQMHAEKEIGSLEVGKKADFVILERNPLGYNPDNLHRIAITATFVDGQKVY